MPWARSRSTRPSPTLRRHLAEIRACEKSGETLKAYAQRQGLSVQALYQAKKWARQQGLLPPHRKPNRARSAPSVPDRRFVEAVRRAEVRDEASRPAWRIRFSDGRVLESVAPLSFDETLRLVEALGERR